MLSDFQGMSTSELGPYHPKNIHLKLIMCAYTELALQSKLTNICIHLIFWIPQIKAKGVLIPNTWPDIANE